MGLNGAKPLVVQFVVDAGVLDLSERRVDLLQTVPITSAHHDMELVEDILHEVAAQPLLIPRSFERR